jgi:hypothetical protein
MAEYDADKPPIEDDIRSEDHEYNPALEPQSAKAWLNLLKESEEAFEDWNKHCDNTDRLFANLEELSSTKLGRTKQYQMFWANLEVIKPAIYAKAPVPVVTPKFKDRRPVYQQASEVMERCCNVAFDLTRINDLMLLVRDDLALYGRGVAWCRYESGSKGYYDHEKVCIDFKGRRDFLHSISRNWREVMWVAAASYLTRSEARERFKDYSGDAYQDCEYRVDKESKNVGGADNRERAKFWEIWHKGSRRVLWVSEGCEDILDEDEPHLELQNFFPCPKPAYGTIQRGSLVPVPDSMQYRDQLDEINDLTAKIHALSEMLVCKGFYPAGGGEAAEAIQTALAMNSPGTVIVPIANWAAFGANKEPIMWMPIEMISATITALVMLRKQIIDDIYQITGMADIMRGDTDPNETLGAQQLKTQYGSSRIRDKQQELVRLARDLVEVTSEIITEKFEEKTIIEMSQTQLPTQKMQEQKMMGVQGQLQQLMQQAQTMKQQGPPPQQEAPDPTQPDPQDQQLVQLNQQIEKCVLEMQRIQHEPTIQQVLELLQNNRVKSFVLDIETDSTVMGDEDAEKQRRTEFVGVLGGLIPQLGQLIQADPQSADMCGKILKFGTAPFRVGRELEGSIDEYVEHVKAMGDQGKAEDPTTVNAKTTLQIEQMKLVYAKQKDDADRQVKIAQIQSQNQGKIADNQIDAQAKQMEVQGRQQEHRAKIVQIQQDGVNKQREHELKLREAAMKAQTEMAKHQAMMQQSSMKANMQVQAQADRRAQQQFKMTNTGGLP